MRRVSAAEVGAAVADVCAAPARAGWSCRPGFRRTGGRTASSSSPTTALSATDLDEIEGVLTGCTVAIAETGTIVLTAAPREGRRAITLVPDLHICVVEEHQIVELVPEAIAALTERARPAGR